MHERRTQLRARTNLAALLVPAHGGEGIPCVVRDLSRSGAQVEVPTGSEIPGSVSLIVGPGGPGEPARLVWRDGDRAGIAFHRDRAGPPVFDDRAAPPGMPAPPSLAPATTTAGWLRGVFGA